MLKVRVVSAYVPLMERTRASFAELGDRLSKACDHNVTFFWNFAFEQCWLAAEKPPWKAANARATDRFETDDEHIRSNIVQHSPVQWATMAAELDPSVDVWVWLGASVMKQGVWRNNPVREDHIRDFLRRVAQFKDYATAIPFPGIEPWKPPSDHGDNWRFVGSTLILPTCWLPAITRSYKFECRRFIRHVGAVPLDLAIWPSVELRSGLPWCFYQAEYDASQFTGFPGA